VIPLLGIYLKNTKTLIFFHIFKRFFIYSFEREREHKQGVGAEGEGEADALLSREPDVELDPRTLGS